MDAMSDDASKFDPRFDPAFQRGYDGPVQPSMRRRPRVESPPEPIGLPPQYSAVERPMVADQLGEYQRRQDVAAGEVRPAREPSGAEDEMIPHGKNPYLAVLTGIGIALVVANLVLIMNIESFIPTDLGPGSQLPYYYVQMIMTGAPLLICLGLATLIGVLFVYAARWKRTP